MVGRLERACALAFLSFVEPDEMMMMMTLFFFLLSLWHASRRWGYECAFP